MKHLIAVVLMVSVAHADTRLTDEMVEHTCDVLEWALDTPFTRAQRDEAHVRLADAWKQHDKATMATVAQLQVLRDKLLKLTPEQRQAAQQKAGADIVAALDKSTDPASKWLRGIYDAGHTALATGEPPLVRQAADAYAEVIGFVLGEARQGKAIVPDRAYEDAVAKALADGWAKLDAQQRTQVAAMPQLWAAIRTQWAALKDSERATYRRQWAKTMAPPAKKSIQQQMLDFQAMSAILKAQHEMNTIIICNMSPNCSYTWHF